MDRIRLLVLLVLASCVAASRAGALTPPEVGDIYVLDMADNQIIRIDPETGAQEEVTAGGRLLTPAGLSIDHEGQLLVVNHAPSPILLVRIDPRTGRQLASSIGLPSLQYFGLASREDGFDCVIDSRGDVFSFISNIRCRNLAKRESRTFPLFPIFYFGTVFAPNGDLIVHGATRDGATLSHIDWETGEEGLWALPLPAMASIGMEASGMVVATVAGRVVRIDPGDGSIEEITQGGLLSYARGIDVEPDGNLVVVSSENDRIVRIDPLTGEQSILSEGGLIDDASRIAVMKRPLPSPPCTLEQTAVLDAERTLTLSHRVGTTAPATWSTYAVVEGELIHVFTEEMPVTDPPIEPPPVVYAELDPIGLVVFLTQIVRDDGKSCWNIDWLFTGNLPAG